MGLVAVRGRFVRFELGGLLNYVHFALLQWGCRAEGMVMDSCCGGTIKWAVWRLCFYY